MTCTEAEETTVSKFSPDLFGTLCKLADGINSKFKLDVLLLCKVTMATTNYNLLNKNCQSPSVWLKPTLKLQSVFNQNKKIKILQTGVAITI